MRVSHEKGLLMAKHWQKKLLGEEGINKGRLSECGGFFSLHRLTPSPNITRHTKLNEFNVSGSKSLVNYMGVYGCQMSLFPAIIDLDLAR